MKHLPFFILLFFLSSCEYITVIGTNTQRLFNVVADDRSADDTVQDLQINTAVRAALTAQDSALLIDVEVTVFEGKVLLTGSVPNGEVLNQILSAVWTVDGVQKVYNYVRTDATPEIHHVASDATFANTIKSKLTLTTGIQSANYKVMVEHGTVYLMGVCASPEEYNKVQNILKDTTGVSKIIFLMRFAKSSEKESEIQTNP